jgi:NADH dehydrogenase
MKILVTGGTGVIGAGAIPALLRAGHEVRLLSRHADRDAPGFPEGVEAFVADIADPLPLRSAVAGCDCVLHIAGIVDEVPPEVTFEKSNVEGTRHLLDAAAAAGEPFFIFISSLGADRGESDYHRSKLRAEEHVKTYPGSWLILRPGNVYGPGDETISMLLKMVRALPVVPMVDSGDQPFQPLWFADLGEAIAQAVDKPDLAGSILELAGPERTTTNDIVGRVAAITGRSPTRLPVPSWLAQMGAEALEAFGGSGKKLLRDAGLEAPLNPAKLSMLREGSVIPEPHLNAMLTKFDVTLTSLADGLAALADMMPEMLPGSGVGKIKQATYSAEIVNSQYSAAELIARVCDNIADVMPIEFAAEPGVPRRADPGVTLTADIMGRGHVQVRLVERSETRVTFVTVEGHPLAGVMQMHAEDLPDAVRFSVHTAAQPATALDWVAMKVVGEAMQAENWRNVVRRVVQLSGGGAPADVWLDAHPMDENEQRDLAAWIDRLVKERQRETRAASIGMGQAAGVETRGK